MYINFSGQYLELRFNSPWLRRLSMLLSFLSIIVFMGIAMYAPTLALAAVTPISSSTHILIMGVVVTVYSSVVSIQDGFILESQALSRKQSKMGFKKKR